MYVRVRVYDAGLHAQTYFTRVANVLFLVDLYSCVFENTEHFYSNHVVRFSFRRIYFKTTESEF